MALLELNNSCHNVHREWNLYKQPIIHWICVLTYLVLIYCSNKLCSLNGTLSHVFKVFSNQIQNQCFFSYCDTTTRVKSYE